MEMGKRPLALRRPAWFRSYQLYLMLLPALVYLIVFKYWPLYGVQIALKK